MRTSHLTAVVVSLGVGLLACSRPARQPAETASPSTPAQASAKTSPARTEPDAASVIDATLDMLLTADPAWGRGLGLHEYDGKVADCSAEGIALQIERLERARAQLATLAPQTLAPDAALDVALVRNAVESVLFQLVDWNAWRKNPLFYQELFGVNDYLDRNYAPLEQRARALLAHEEAALLQLPHVRQNWVSPLPRPMVETAVKVYAGYAEYLRGDVVRLLQGAGDAEFQRRFAEVNARLASEAEELSQGLATGELSKSDDGFALGEDRYRKLVRIQEGLTLPLAEFARMAEGDLSANRSAYEALARRVEETRPRAPALLREAGRTTEDARAFVVEHGIVTMPGEQRPSVRETPPYMRWNQAFLVGPGPFDAEGLEAYYYITLPDRSWPVPKQREYVMTRGELVSTTVHETYPGHFVQGQWLRRAPTRAQKTIDTYSFSEGWAHYVEQMMIDEGFVAESHETRLGQLADALLRDCRFVVSIGIHTQGMTLQAAERRFIDECHQDVATAHEQAVRGTFDPGYFAYTLGKLQILELRAEARRRLGASFSLQRFHDALLSHGSPPIPLIRERVLAELK